VSQGNRGCLGENCHIVVHEAGAPSVIAGVQTRCVPDPGGVLEPAEIKKRLRKKDLHSPATSLICMENAHSSGRVVSLEDMDAVRAIANEWALPVHLDGARIFNAAAALGCNASDIAARVDSVMFCLSKSLCAPIGSLLAGTKEFISAARFKRKIMGGGMRQAGILAAAGIIALTEHSLLLGADHLRAKKLAQGLAKIKGVNIIDNVDINMVFFKYRNEAAAMPAAEFARNITGYFASRGVIINPPEQGMFRFVTHYWIGDKEIDTILAAAEEAFCGHLGKGGR